MSKTEKTFAQFLASFLINDFAGIARQECGSVDGGMLRIPADSLGPIVRLNFDQFITRQQMRRVLRFFMGRGVEPDEETVIDILCVAKLLMFVTQKDAA